MESIVPTPAEERAYRAAMDAELLASMRRSVVLTAVLAVLIGVVAAHTLATHDRLVVELAGVGAALAMLLVWPACSLRWFVARPIVLTIAVSWAVVACISVASAYTGGFGSPLAMHMIFMWLFGALVGPIGMGRFLFLIGTEVVMMFSIITALAPAPGPMGFWLVSMLVGSSLGIVGSTLRERASARAFASRLRLAEAHRELAESRASLADLNRELETRVAEQVREIVRRAGDVEALNAQLQLKVQERSRELALALERLGASGPRLSAGAKLGDRATLVRAVAEGGMGQVFLARDEVTGGDVAIKLIRPEIATGAEALRRFVAEAEVAASVRHPGIVRTLHIDVTPEGQIYQLMEWVDGVPLSAELGHGPLAPADAARIGAVCASALAAAHAASVIHRDIKPSNLMLCAQAPGLRILDFGISKRAAGDAQLTRTGHALGTPAYMSPEQSHDAASVTPATDIYSLGVMVFQLLAGRLPFAAADTVGQLVAHRTEAPALDALVGVPEELVRLVARCLDKTPTARPSAAELAALLGELADRLGAPPLERRPRRGSGAGDSPADTASAAPRRGRPRRLA